MQDQTIIDNQLQFYREGRAGCLFAAHAAIDPAKYGWRLCVVDPTVAGVESPLREAIASPTISTSSLIFPTVRTWSDLKALLTMLRTCPSFFVGQSIEVMGTVCLGYRVRIGDLTSWVTGFGPFEFLPATRRSPYTEIALRTKPRPNYRVVMKEAPEGVIHLADMDMLAMSRDKFTSLWDGSFENTAKVLGHKPDLRSAAKTTFAVPIAVWSESSWVEARRVTSYLPELVPAANEMAHLV